MAFKQLESAFPQAGSALPPAVPLPKSALRILLRFRSMALVGLLAASGLAGAAGCSPAAGPGSPEDPIELTRQQKAVLDGSNSFAFDLVRVLSEKDPEGSFVVSPLSVSLAFGMALNGAEGDTHDQIARTLGFEGLTKEEVSEAARTLIPALTGADESASVLIANAIWARQGAELRQEFVTANREAYQAEVSELDFADPGSADVVNGWVSEQTKWLIEKMIDRLDPEALLYLANAVYFKADWTVQFNPEQTRTEPFRAGDGRWQDAPMMRVKEAFGFYEGESWRAAELPYGSGAYRFLAVQPMDGEDLGAFAGRLDQDAYAQVLDGLEADTVEVYMPRFEISHRIADFKGDLRGLGMELPFTEQADFSGIHPTLRLLISDVLHQSVIKVDETGSEAAGVTILEIRTTSVGPPEPRIRLDRPFLFFIREQSTGTILFAGRYSGQPS